MLRDKLTKEECKISMRNKRKAWNYFISIGQIPFDAKPFSYVLHHKDMTLIDTNKAQYIEWRIEDLIVMPYGEHSTLHNKGRKHSQKTKEKISKTLKGTKLSTSTKKKIGESHKGKHFYNNGKVNVQTYLCPNGFVKGRLPFKWKRSK